MSETEKTILTGAQPVVTDATATASRTGANTDKRISITTPASVKDAGRVHVGAGMMRF
jgi:hypothetical protein